MRVLSHSPSLGFVVISENLKAPDKYHVLGIDKVHLEVPEGGPA